MTEQNIKKLYDQILSEGLKTFSMSMGIVSHIENDWYEILAVKSNSNVFVAGESFPLQSTYCRDVIESGEAVALTELGGKPGLCKHPLYEGLSLEAYICAPIYKDGKIWGTLNFSSMKIKDSPFTSHEKALIEERAKQISNALSKGLT